MLDPKTSGLLREHLRQECGRHRIAPEDRPTYARPETEQLLCRAEHTGTNIGM